MNKTILSLTSLLLISGCASEPSSSPITPDPHPNKYALQVLRIEVPVSDTASPHPVFNAPSDGLEELLKNHEAVISEFPIVYAAAGETAVADQTTPCPAPKTLETARDEQGNLTVISSDETRAVGRYVEFTIYEIKNGNVSYHVVAADTQLAGKQQVNLKAPDGGTDTVFATRPIFQQNKIDTKLMQAPSTWLSMGGRIREKVENRTFGKVKKSRIKKVSFARILSPSASQ